MSCRALAWRGLAALASCALALGCSSASNEGAPSNGDDAGSSDAAPPGHVVAPATTGSWSALEDVSFQGKGAKDLGAIAIDHGVGTIELQGQSAQAFFFTSTSVPTGTADGGNAFAGSRDFEIIAAQADRLIVSFITCTDGKLAYVFYETTDGLSSSTAIAPDGELAATGTCDIVEKAATEAVSLPALDLAPPPLVAGFQISGSDLSFDGTSAGKANVQGEGFAVYPFNVVDCTGCATPGWYELHSVLYDAATNATCLGIFYLNTGAPTEVELAYEMCLPSVTAPLPDDQLFFDSSWTGSPAKP